MHKTTLKVLISTLTLTLAIFVGSYFYYDNVNSAEDPRIMPALKLLQKYEKQLEEDQPALALSILDEMEKIYSSTPGYEGSYELGVIANNKASVFLIQIETKILEEKEINKEEMVKSLNISKKHTLDAMNLYANWMKEMGSLTEVEIEKRIFPFFSENDPGLIEVDVDAVLQKRVKDIIVAQTETKRRMSVTLTNLGFIHRYLGELEKAKQNYESAIELWERNYTAQDNLAMLMNQPVQKRSMIQKLFPPERVAEEEK